MSAIAPELHHHCGQLGKESKYCSRFSSPTACFFRCIASPGVISITEYSSPKT